MKMKKYIATIGLVTLLLVCGMNVAYAGVPQEQPDYQQPQVPDLRISEPSNGASFLEGSTIEIRVLDIDNNGIYMATVYIIGTDKVDLTNEEGYAELTPDLVEQDTPLTIRAEKYGYENFDEVDILIKNKQLIVTPSVSEIDENSEFFCTVTDQDGNAVSLALVTFNGKYKFTNSNGVTAEFSAPWVNYDKKYDIEAVKSGYDKGLSEILVRQVYDPIASHVTGRVADQYLHGVSGATVYCNAGGIDYSTTTDVNGDFSFYVTPYEGGQWVLFSASKSGYRQTILSFVLKFLDGTGNGVYVALQLKKL